MASRDPDISHGQLQRRAQATQPFTPAAHRAAVVTLAAECVMFAEAVMDVWGAVPENDAVVTGVDALEVFDRDLLDDRVIAGRLVHGLVVLARDGALEAAATPPQPTPPNSTTSITDVFTLFVGDRLLGGKPNDATEDIAQ